MADLRDLPNEVLVMITRSMVGRRIDHFDPVATRDLQSLRLVSPRVCHVTSRWDDVLSGDETVKLSNTVL